MFYDLLGLFFNVLYFKFNMMNFFFVVKIKVSNVSAI